MTRRVLTLLLTLLLGVPALVVSACDDEPKGPTDYIVNGQLLRLPPGGQRFFQELEVGDSITTTNTISDIDDADGFEFRLAEPGRVDVEMNATGSLNPFLELYRENGNFVRDDDDSGPNRDAFLTADLAAGKYFIVAWSSLDGPFSGEYELIIRVSEPGDGGAGSFDADGRLISTPPGGSVIADALFPFADPVTAEAGISDEFDADGYPFTLSLATRLVVSVESLDQLNPFVEIYDSNGDLVVDDDDGGVGSDALLVVDLDAGSYTIVVWSSLDGPDAGDYKMVVQAATQDGADFEYIPVNDSRSALDQELFAGEDALCYVFSLDDPANVSLTVTQQGGGMADIALQLIDQRGNEVFFLDPAGTSDPMDGPRSLARGTYILVVSNDSAAPGSIFNLLIDVAP